MAFFIILLHPVIDSERGIFEFCKEIFICKDKLNPHPPKNLRLYWDRHVII